MSQDDKKDKQPKTRTDSFADILPDFSKVTNEELREAVPMNLAGSLAKEFFGENVIFSVDASSC